MWKFQAKIDEWSQEASLHDTDTLNNYNKALQWTYNNNMADFLLCFKNFSEILKQN